MKLGDCPIVIKICGLTSLKDALSALEAGADILGFNFYPYSKRYIEPTHCKEIITGVKSRMAKAVTVGVFVNASMDEIRNVIQVCRLHLAQLCGDEPAEFLVRLGGTGFKALHVQDADGLQAALHNYPPRPLPPAYLIDAYSPGEYGGTGHTANWLLAAQVAAKAPILLAGGLTPDNVAQAVAQVRPWGVDVASGVESIPGIKDYDKMRRFIQQARNANQYPNEQKY